MLLSEKPPNFDRENRKIQFINFFKNINLWLNFFKIPVEIRSRIAPRTRNFSKIRRISGEISLPGGWLRHHQLFVDVPCARLAWQVLSMYESTSIARFLGQMCTIYMDVPRCHLYKPNPHPKPEHPIGPRRPLVSQALDLASKPDEPSKAGAVGSPAR